MHHLWECRTTCEGQTPDRDTPLAQVVLHVHCHCVRGLHVLEIHRKAHVLTLTPITTINLVIIIVAVVITIINVTVIVMARAGRHR